MWSRSSETPWNLWPTKTVNSHRYASEPGATASCLSWWIVPHRWCPHPDLGSARVLCRIFVVLKHCNKVQEVSAVFHHAFLFNFGLILDARYSTTGGQLSIRGSEANDTAVLIQFLRNSSAFSANSVSFRPGRGHLALAQTRRRYSPWWSSADLKGGHRNSFPGPSACASVEEVVPPADVTSVGSRKSESTSHEGTGWWPRCCWFLSVLRKTL